MLLGFCWERKQEYGSLDLGQGSLGSLGEPLDNAETASVSDMGSMYTVTSLDNQPLAARPIKGFAVVEVSTSCLGHHLNHEQLESPQPLYAFHYCFLGTNR